MFAESVKQCLRRNSYGVSGTRRVLQLCSEVGLHHVQLCWGILNGMVNTAPHLARLTATALVIFSNLGACTEAQGDCSIVSEPCAPRCTPGEASLVYLSRGCIVPRSTVRCDAPQKQIDDIGCWVRASDGVVIIGSSSLSLAGDIPCDRTLRERLSTITMVCSEAADAASD
jgi:hypothetical protein